jgi:hypothetical protein
MTASTEVFNSLVAETYSYLEKEQSRIAQAKSIVQEAANAEVRSDLMFYTDPRHTEHKQFPYSYS